MNTLSPRKRHDIVNALRTGTVPDVGLDALAVGLAPYEQALSDELDTVSQGGAVFKAVRGEYGCGKTFFTRHFAERAAARGFATAEVQVSETETPLHRLETVYRRITESLRTSGTQPSAFQAVIDAWLFGLEDDAAAANPGLDVQSEDMTNCVSELLEDRLRSVSATTPAWAQALRGYWRAQAAGDFETAQGLLSWMAGQPHVAAAAKRTAGLRGDLDHFGALGFLQGLLTVLRDSGRPGLVVVLDEVETLQRVRGDVRDKALNALRQLIDEISGGKLPGLYLMITGTPAFFDGPNGVQRLAPLAARLATDFTSDPRFDNPRASQVRLQGFDHDRLVELGCTVRDLYADGRESRERIGRRVDDAYVAELARAVAGGLGGKVGIAPRVFLKKLVDSVLDRVDQFEDFDPRRDYTLTVRSSELNDVERAASRPDDVQLEGL